METFDVSEFLKYYWSKILYICLFTLLGLLISLVYTCKLQVPIFKSETSIVLVNNSEENTTITQNDITINKNLVDTYADIIQSKKVLNRVIDELDLDIDYEDLKKNVAVKAKENTEIIIISTFDENAEIAKNIANKIADVFEEEITSIYNIENVSVIDEAEEADTAYNVHPAKQFLIGIGGGFILSSMVVLIFFYFDDTIKNSEDIEKDLKVAILGQIPKYESKSDDGKKTDLIICKDSKSGISEAIRTLRTNLQFTSIDKSMKTILITSSIPSEGKSFVAANLAVSLANSGKNVLLIDADIRRGRQHRIFGFHNKKGLSDLLLDNASQVYSSYISRTDVPNLYLMCKGSTPPNPSELLNSEKNKKLITTLSNNFDIIILDGAPINGLADSLVLSTLVDGVIVVAAERETTKTILESTKKNLDNVEANMIGVVLNKSEKSKNSYYYGYY